MAKIFYDCEFLEGTQKIRLGKIELPKMFDTKNTIDLISIGLVSEDNRELYLISKDFNLKEAWNRYDLKQNQGCGDANNLPPRKVFWIRENVLKPIFIELWQNEKGAKLTNADFNSGIFNYKHLKSLISKYGKTNKQIAEEVKAFCTPTLTGHNLRDNDIEYNKNYSTPIFYGYYSAYDHVALCWLFGKMIDLPKGFPMYTIDLKQMLDEKIEKLPWLYLRDTWNNSRMSVYNIGKGDSQEKDRPATFEEKLKRVKELEEYPKQTNEHSAKFDARFNKQLHDFLLK